MLLSQIFEPETMELLQSNKNDIKTKMVKLLIM